ncbi:MFS general substrate transporter [Trichoderma longibrachiatum ATCC 18648]|uniref:MFS general substrate transporter n=1 Tax=Trichoderma longibrachiatum ATCC 18648 TaxID=983965 RepID=A0A2T4BQI6_TRILO|nr:MFS general substrate transporter [Trichoderma longibrachiatum ATCC 18648]
MASSGIEKEIASADGVDIQSPKDVSTGGIQDVDGEEVEFSQDQRLVIESARAAAAKEQSMTLLQGIKLYPKAIAWSIIISTCIVMEGYDVSLVNNFYAFPQFNEKYGELYPDGTYQVPARWQSGLSNGATVGEIIGLFINGFVSERFGYRKTVMGCLILVAAFTAIFFTAPNVQTLLVAEILCGIPWGIFQTLTVTYASEVCPVALRGYLTTYVNFCWGLGQEIGIGVIYAMLKRNDQWAYRIPYGLQWMWPLPLFIAIYFAPESPWWLIRRGKAEDAKKSLLRLTSLNRETDFDADETVAMMVHTTALEEKMTAGASYWDCFKGVDLRRTEIGGICFCCIVYTYFRIPEPRGRTFAELDVLFEKKIPARKFASTKVDVFHESIDEKVMHQYDGIMKTHVEKVLLV